MDPFILVLVLSACREEDPAPALAPPSPEAPEVPMIGEALADRCPDPTPRVPDTTDGDMHVATLTGATSSCNDGSPPSLYIRAGEPGHEGDWVLFLEGGKHCDLYEDCAVRWCGEEDYDASHMSSRWLPQTRAGAGIALQSAANSFSGYNQVYFHYCSSDRWTGTHEGFVFDDAQPAFRLNFLGSEIVSDAIDALSAGLSSDDGLVSLPQLSSAERVILSGSSAGGVGVVLNLDRVAEMLPLAEVIGLPDALFYADPLVLPPDVAATLSQNTVQRHEQRSLAWGALLDGSCVALHGEDPVCSDLDYVLREQISTPFLLHHDLLDPAIYEGSYGALLPVEEYAQAAVDTFTAWQQQGVGSVFLTGCGVHQYVPETVRFFGWTTAPEEGDPQNLHDAFDAFAQGRRPLYVLDDRSGSGSSCSAP